MPDVALIVVAVVASAVLAGAMVTWARMATRWREGLPLIAWQPAPVVPWGIGHVLLCAVTGLLINQWLLLAVGATFSTPLNELTSQELNRVSLAGSAANLLATAAGVAILVWLARAGRQDLGLPADSAQAASDVRLGFAAFAAVTPVVYAIQAILVVWFPSEHPIKTMLDDEQNLGNIAVALLAAIVMAPLFEEFFFRLVVQGWFERMETLWLLADDDPRTPRDEPSDGDGSSVAERGVCDGASDAATPGARGTVADDETAGSKADAGSRRGRLPIFASSGLFALMHASHGPDPVALFVLALALGYLYSRTHRILPSIVVHFLFNALSMLFYFAQKATT